MCVQADRSVNCIYILLIQFVDTGGKLCLRCLKRLDLLLNLIVHLVIRATAVNGTMYFMAKGGGNSNPYPQTPQNGLDAWDYNMPPGVSQDLVVGKVVNTNYK